MTAKAAKSPNHKAKTNTPGGMDWQALETVGDVRRMFRFCILEVKRGRLSPKKSNAMVYAGSYILASFETEEFERRLAKLEEDRGGSNDGGVINISVSK